MVAFGSDSARVLQTKVARNPSYVPDFTTAFSHLLIHPGALIVIDQVPMPRGSPRCALSLYWPVSAATTTRRCMPEAGVLLRKATLDDVTPHANS